MKPLPNYKFSRVSVLLYFVAVSQIFFVAFAVYNYVLFFQTDRIVSGTIGIASAALALVLAVTRLLPTNASAFLDSYIFFLYSNLYKWVVVTAVIWLSLIVWSYQMSNDIFGRIIYVKYIQDALDQGEFDRAALPDAKTLASAFEMFPNRREVPVLLGRSSRLLYWANRRDIFRSFQRSFLESVDLDSVVAKECRDKSALPRHDGLLLLMSVAGEAYSPKADLPPAEHKSDVDGVVANLTKFMEPVRRCRTGSLEAQFQLIKFQQLIDEILEIDTKDTISAALVGFDDALQKASQRAVLAFWQSHGAQEYLDFQAYLLLTSVNRRYRADDSSNSSQQTALDVVKAMSLFEKMLLLRQGLQKSGDVAWSTSPYKLNLFYAFMMDANILTLVWDDVVPIFATTPSVKQAAHEFTSRKLFDEFRTPKGWYAGTPLDSALNGRALAEKMSSWLKTEW